MKIEIEMPKSQKHPFSRRVGQFFLRLIRRVFFWLLWTAAGFAALSLVSVLIFRWLDPPTTSFMIQYQTLETRPKAFQEIRYRWVDLERISKDMQLAAVAAEDQKFFDHAGFDFESISDAVEDRFRGDRLRGASTISQQTAKNLFLWPGRSFMRKGLEAWFTMLLELLWPKARILEVYLNIAEFGRGIYGVEAAARHFFGKPAAVLSPFEAAVLAAVLPNPRRLRADRPSAYVRDRARWILEQMRLLGPDYLSVFTQRYVILLRISTESNDG